MRRIAYIVLLIQVPLLFARNVAAPKTVKVYTLADSEAAGYESSLAMDNDPGTMWHSQFGSDNPSHPHDITIDLGDVYSLTGFRYFPRQDGSQNGTIREYEFFISNDTTDFGKPVFHGRFQNISEDNNIVFPKPVRGRFVRLRALSEINDRPWTSIAELKLLSDGGHSFLSFRYGIDMEEPETELELQYKTLQQELKRRSHIASLAEQTCHPAALLFETDRDPTDVVLRRTRILLDDLKTGYVSAQWERLEQELEAIRNLCNAVEPGDALQRFAAYLKLCDLRRRIAFSNPLLDFDKILFITRHRSLFNHMCDQYYGINTLPGGALCVLEDPFGLNPQVHNILAESTVNKGRLIGTQLTEGSFLSPDLSYDAKSVTFAYVECKGDTEHRYHTDPERGHWHPQRCYHLFKVNLDGSNLQQLTDGTWNDFDPCWLPNGRIAFISERRGGYLRCGRVCPTYTLYDMALDGGDIRCLSPHETNEWHPGVTHDGMIIYTRWDYVDRHGCTAHLPWTTTPDGHNARAVHGNFSPREVRPDMELDFRAIPGSHRFIATAAPHHGQAFGSLVIIDPHIEDDDAMAPVRRITPEVDFPETQGGAQVYGTAWPLSEKYYLAVYDPTMQIGMGGQGQSYRRGNYGIYLVDVFGNKELLYRDPEIACQNPIPLRPRQRPPVVPDAALRVAQDEPAEGTMAVMNVYDSLAPWPKGIRIKALRIYQILPMSVPSGEPPHEIGLRLPTGLDSVILARYVLGTAPVEADGSAHFYVPAKKEVFFQALDQDGLAIQSMRSATYVQPGEQLLCQGCHEPRHRAPSAPQRLPLALQRPPSRLRPDVDGSNPFSYPRLVQPVLDKHCVACHKEQPEKAPRLDDEVIVKGRQKWYASYFSLAPEFGYWKYGNRHRTTPGQFGARASKLYALLKEGHYDVKLSEEDMHRMTLWLDSCSVFYGVYEEEGGIAQLQGKIVQPTLE
ncbi:MAG: discoidin domain-containing protein [Sedimentisphaerales bacterium]|nr:discoidin domain-containing protein [Sedimentisphaerales bacterium]